jgi:hypothetical protein
MSESWQPWANKSCVTAMLLIVLQFTPPALRRFDPRTSAMHARKAQTPSKQAVFMRLASHFYLASRINTGSRHFQTILVFPFATSA